MKSAHLIPGISDHQTDRLFPELRGFQITMETEEAMMAVEDEILERLTDLDSLEAEMDDVRYQLGEVEMEIAELRSKERSLEEREAVEVRESLQSKAPLSPASSDVPSVPGHRMTCSIQLNIALRGTRLRPVTRWRSS